MHPHLLSEIPSPTLKRGRLYLNIALLHLRSYRNSGFPSMLNVRAFSPVEELTMPSADSCSPIPRPHDPSSTKADEQASPGNAHLLSRLYPPHIRPYLPCRYRTLKIFASSSGTTASYAIPVRRTSDLPTASFRFRLAANTLAVRLTVPPAGPVEDFYLQEGSPCRARIKKRPGILPGLPLTGC